MKITKLVLKNFLPILSGMGKEEITLDLNNTTELINIFIGKIGSGKTYVLSHLQPFATVGTLDVRNADDPIIPEKDGLKIIEYLKDNHEYTIIHEYKWTGKSHSKKSYIQKDGIELNENGNSSSFKEIILLEFGIDQSFLQLMRLGPNVINFINMKATERKAYIASLLNNTELYLLLYKHWSSDLRTLNTKSSILMNKLNSYGKKTDTEIKDEMMVVEDKIQEITNVINSATKKKYELEAKNSSLLDGKTYNEFKMLQLSLDSEQDGIVSQFHDIESNLKKYKEYPEITEVSKTIGGLDNQLLSVEENLEKLNKDFTDCDTELLSMRDRKAMSFNEDHMETLKETYASLLKQGESYKKSLIGFDCNYTSTFLSGFLGDLNTMNILINELFQYNPDMIRTLYHSDSSVIKFAKDKVEVLNYRKIKVEKLMSNIKYSETYEPFSTLYIPPFCPTKNCPYFKTHPSTIQRKNKNKNGVNEELIKYQNELKDLEIEIYKYTDYPLIYSKISTLKSYWIKAKPILQNVGALKCNDLLQIITNLQSQVWYDYDKIVDTMQLIEIKNKYAELMENIKTIKTEINELSVSDLESINQKINELEKQKDSLSLEIEENEKLRAKVKAELVSYNQMYVDLSNKSVLESQYEELKQSYQKNKETLSSMKIHEDEIQSNSNDIQEYSKKILEKTEKLKGYTAQLDSLKTTLNDIKYTSKELNDNLIEIKYMSKMVDAVSSKKGIPLVMIQIFLDSCRDIVNDMIYDVCEDSLEVLPFKINETEFKIPYMVNGQKIDDVSKASQGQSSIISTAMSFALVKQAGFTDYNIPLLDEMDAPLHKTDKQKFIVILLKYLKEIGSEQCFTITHDDNTFDGYPVQVIMTTDENVNKDKYKNVIKL